MAKFYLIRHGETDFNKKKILQGRIDSDLSELGHEQAKSLAARLKECCIDAVYSSELSRAKSTAQHIADAHGVAVNGVTAFNEIDFGKWEGQLLGFMLEEDRELFDKWRKDEHFDGHGGESRAKFRQRVLAAFDIIVKDHPEGDVAIVTHALTNKIILNHIMGIADRNYFILDQKNTCVNLVDIKDWPDGEKRILSINDCSHIK